VPIPAVQELQQPEPHRTSPVFRSVLFDEPPDGPSESQEPPEYFSDLKLDQIVASITSGWEEYNLKPFFYMPLGRLEAIQYRHDVFRDLETRELFAHVRCFGHEMREMRRCLAQANRLFYNLQKQRWFLDAVNTYCRALTRLADVLVPLDLVSQGFRRLRKYLISYTGSDDFLSLEAETHRLITDLSEIRYCIHVDGKRITVSQYGSEPDYGADVLRTFDKFQQGGREEYRFDFLHSPDMNHVEAAILDLVAQLYPQLFLYLEQFCIRHDQYLEATIARFDREVQFYIAYLEHISALRKAELRFSYPVVSDRSKEVNGSDVFDLALANKLVREHSAVVANDFYLEDHERIFVVSGPNQGGKTTFARTFGQLHHLASIGCLVPGSKVRVFLFDRLFTHFEKEEDIQNLSGKLEDDLLRIREVLEHATPKSILIMNESFLSTTLSDALFLSKEVMRQVIERDMLCVSVTFLEELASLSKATVSMVSTVDAKDPAVRTFKVARKPADGLAYATALAAKYRLTYNEVKARIDKNTNRPGSVT
jgi:DNA mismatch repair protein MutS